MSSVVMQKVVLLTIVMLSVFMLSVFMLSVFMLSVFMLSVFMLSFVKLSVEAFRGHPCSDSLSFNFIGQVSFGKMTFGRLLEHQTDLFLSIFSLSYSIKKTIDNVSVSLNSIMTLCA